MTDSSPTRPPQDALYPRHLPPDVVPLWEAAQQTDGLAQEIALLRVVLALLVRDPGANHQNVCRVLTVLIRALQTQARDGTPAGDTINDAAEQALREKEAEG